MNVVFALAKRNCQKFFRDKMSVFFSMLGVLIVLMLYILFLRNMMLDSYDLPGGESLIDSWIMAGMLAIAAITSALGSFEVLVNDKVFGSSKMFSVSPMTPMQTSMGYILSSFIISFMLSMVTFIFAELYIVINGGDLLTVINILKVIGIVILGTASSCAIMFFVTSFFKTTNSFSIACTVVGTLIGFLTGVYLPIGILPSAIQSVVKLIPASHEALLLRQTFMEVPEKQYFDGLPESDIHDFNVNMGNIFQIGDSDLAPWVSIAMLAGTAVLFIVLSALNLSRKQK